MFCAEDDFDLDDKFWEEQLQEDVMPSKKPVKRKSFDLNPEKCDALSSSDPLGLNLLLNKKQRKETGPSASKSVLTYNKAQTKSAISAHVEEDPDLNDNLLYSALDSIEASDFVQNDPKIASHSEEVNVYPSSRDCNSPKFKSKVLDEKASCNSNSKGTIHVPASTREKTEVVHDLKCVSVQGQVDVKRVLENVHQQGGTLKKPATSGSVFPKPNSSISSNVNNRNSVEPSTIYDKNDCSFNLQFSPGTFDEDMDLDTVNLKEQEPPAPVKKQKSPQDNLHQNKQCCNKNTPEFYRTKARELFKLQLSPTSFDGDFDLSATKSPSWNPVINSRKQDVESSVSGNIDHPVLRQTAAQSSVRPPVSLSSKVDDSAMNFDYLKNEVEMDISSGFSSKNPAVNSNVLIEGIRDGMYVARKQNETNICASEYNKTSKPHDRLNQLRDTPIRSNLATSKGLLETTTATGNGKGNQSRFDSAVGRDKFASCSDLTNRVSSNYSHKTTVMKEQTVQKQISPKHLEETNPELSTLPLKHSFVKEKEKVNVSESRPYLSDDAVKTPVCTVQHTPSFLSGSKVTGAAGSFQEGSTPTSVRASGGKRRRKFPGPAGVLPKLKAGLDLAAMNGLKAASPVLSMKKELKEPDEMIVSSQSCEDRFQEEQWLAMKANLEPQAANVSNKYCLAEVIKMASKKQLPRGKVPVVCALIEQISTVGADASVLLRDPSGVMKGTVHRNLVKDFQTQLVAGTVLVLRQCGVFSPTPRSHYLNITANNVVRIYSRQLDGQSRVENLSEFVKEDFVVHKPKVQSSIPSVNSPASSSLRGARGTMPGPQQPLFGGIKSNTPVTPRQISSTPRTFTPSNYRLNTPQPRFETPQNPRTLLRTNYHNSVHQQQNQNQRFEVRKSASNSFTGTNTTTNLQPPRCQNGVGITQTTQTVGQSSFNCRPVLVSKSLVTPVLRSKLPQQTNPNSPHMPLKNVSNTSVSTPDGSTKKFSFRKASPTDNVVASKSQAKSVDPRSCGATLDFSLHDENLDDLLTGIEDELLTDM